MSKRILEDWVDGYLELTENSEPPVTFKLWSAIAAIASVLQRKCRLDWGSLTFYPNMYIVLVGPPATRKGTAIKPMQDMIEDIGIKLSAEATTRESLIRTLKEANEEYYEEGKQIPKFHSSLTVIAPELTSFLGFNNLQFLSDLADWFDCRERWTYRTKGKGEDIIIGLFVNLFGGTTPELIKSSLPLEAIGSGLSSRIIFVYEEKKGKVVPCPFYSDVQLVLKEDLYSDLQQIHLMRGVFQVSSKFVNNWIDWYTLQSNNPPFQDPKFAGYCERRGLHTMKLCMILSASRSSNMLITHDDLDRAIKILQLTERKMSYTFRGLGKDPQAETVNNVMKTIAMAGKNGITFSKLQEIHLSDASKWHLEKILETLNAMKWLVGLAKGNETVYMMKKLWDKMKEEDDNVSKNL